MKQFSYFILYLTDTSSLYMCRTVPPLMAIIRYGDYIFRRQPTGYVVINNKHMTADPLVFNLSDQISRDPTPIFPALNKTAGSSL